MSVKDYNQKFGIRKFKSGDCVYHNEQKVVILSYDGDGDYTVKPVIDPELLKSIIVNDANLSLYS